MLQGSKMMQFKTDKQLGFSKNAKSIDHKGHIVLKLRSQRTILQDIGFVHFVPSSCALWLRRTF
jgi:hypothetical protein